MVPKALSKAVLEGCSLACHLIPRDADVSSNLTDASVQPWSSHPRRAASILASIDGLSTRYLLGASRGPPMDAGAPEIIAGG